MKQFLLSLAVCLLLMVGIHHWVLAIYTLPETGNGGGFMGHRVLVNKLDCTPSQRGEKLLFNYHSTTRIGIVTALPGDTIQMEGKTYLIPEKCVCLQTDCKECRMVVVNTNGNVLLIQQDKIIGKVLAWPPTSNVQHAE